MKFTIEKVWYQKPGDPESVATEVVDEVACRDATEAHQYLKKHFQSGGSDAYVVVYYPNGGPPIGTKRL